MCILKIYVLGKTPMVNKMVSKLEEAMERNFGEEYALEIIDLLENPQLAEENKIIATPTIVRQLPPPIRKVIGNLNEPEKVLVGLDLINN